MSVMKENVFVTVPPTVARVCTHIVIIKLNLLCGNIVELPVSKLAVASSGHLRLDVVVQIREFPNVKTF